MASLLRVGVGVLFGSVILLAWAGLPLDRPYVGYGLASAFVFQLAVRPRRWELLAVLLAATTLVVFSQVTFHRGRPPLEFVECFGLLGLVSFSVLGFRAIWATGQEREELKSILVPAAAFTFFSLGSAKLLNLGGLLYPRTLDLYAYAFDGSLGFQPSFVIGRLFRNHAYVGLIGSFTYFSLPLAMALLYAGHLRRRKGTPLFVLELFMLSGLLGYFLYLAFPATGPLYLAGPAFPRITLPLAVLRKLVLRPVALDWGIPRNAMPSLHMTWALLIWFNSKPFSRLTRTLAFMFLLTTMVDTLGTGEHYLIDLVVAFPFAVAVQAICNRVVPMKSRNRWLPILGCVCLVTIWLVLLRTGERVFLLTPAIPWACILASTVLSACWLKHIVSAEPA
ncbi:MAG: phosphatase PAP2 family protein, partial [Acidobacteria bacterium]|nr:phosphatase PAP2 family protein [Acidobacteriota bacterium]